MERCWQVKLLTKSWQYPQGPQGVSAMQLAMAQNSVKQGGGLTTGRPAVERVKRCG